MTAWWWSVAERPARGCVDAAAVHRLHPSRTACKRSNNGGSGVRHACASAAARNTHHHDDTPCECRMKCFRCCRTQHRSAAVVDSTAKKQRRATVECRTAQTATADDAADDASATSGETSRFTRAHAQQRRRMMRAWLRKRTCTPPAVGGASNRQSAVGCGICRSNFENPAHAAPSQTPYKRVYEESASQMRRMPANGDQREPNNARNSIRACSRTQRTSTLLSHSTATHGACKKNLSRAALLRFGINPTRSDKK